MKISVLCPDLSDNCLGRAYLLAKILQRRYDVEISGPMFGNSIWEAVAQLNDMDYQYVKIDGFVKPYVQLADLVKKINGDVIYASKPLFTSFGLGLLAKLIHNRPLVLDIDDWQMGFVMDGLKNRSWRQNLGYFARSALRPYQVDSYLNNLLCERLSHHIHDITVSNSFLQRRFGGSIIWHAKDQDLFNPDRYDNKKMRNKHGLGLSDKLILFLGTPGTHKGLEDLIRSVSRIEDKHVKLMIVGLGNDSCSSAIAEYAKAELRDRCILFSLQLFTVIPEFLSVSDIIVIPQRRNLCSIGQLPAKLFDAMAMAKPIISTNVSDIPHILNGCGWIVEPENINQMQQAIELVLNNLPDAEKRGQKARQQFLDKYSYNSVEKSLLDIFKKYE